VSLLLIKKALILSLINPEMGKAMSITLTENAAKQILKKLAKRGKGIALRVGVKKVGCSGFAYTFDYADNINADDQLFESHNANVVVDTSSLQFLDGSNIDFVREGLNDSFKFENPNIDNTCGCGESFSLKEPVTHS
jgi:iron-sulfur cluster assembly protein